MKEQQGKASYLRRILRLMWSETDAFARRRGVIALLMAAGSAVLAALAPVSLKLAVDEFARTPTALHVAPALLVAAYVASHWLARCLNDLRWVVYGPARQRLQRRISLRVFAHVMDLPLRFHVDRKTGAVSQTLAQGVVGCQLVIDQLLLITLPIFIEFATMALVLSRIGHATILHVVATVAILYATVFAIGIRHINRQSQVVSASEVETSAVMTDTILNYETVKCFNAEGFVQEGYDRALAKTESGWSRFYRVLAANGLAVSVVFAGSLAVSLGYAAHQVTSGTMSVGEFVLINAYMMQLVRPLEALGVVVQSISRGLGFATLMLDLLQHEPEPRSAARATGREAAGFLQFDHVTFAYRADTPLLRDVYFAVAPGKTLAVVGASGAGKSSLVRLLLRLYEPGGGRILLDGVAIDDLALSSLRDVIAVVPQDTILFNETIGYNIAFGRPGSTIADIERAARIAHLHDFIASLPEGYETTVGERGVKLSGGEKQRVAIARAALKGPRIYVFDEATASLDTPTERAILRDFIDATKGCTTIMVAHRLSTVVHADEIIFLESGTIAERGTHAALLRQRGRYASMWWSQQHASPFSGERVLTEIDNPREALAQEARR